MAWPSPERSATAAWLTVPGPRPGGLRGGPAVTGAVLSWLQRFNAPPPDSPPRVITARAQVADFTCRTASVTSLSQALGGDSEVGEVSCSSRRLVARAAEPSRAPVLGLSSVSAGPPATQLSKPVDGPARPPAPAPWPATTHRVATRRRGHHHAGGGRVCRDRGAVARALLAGDHARLLCSLRCMPVETPQIPPGLMMDTSRCCARLRLGVDCKGKETNGLRKC